MSANVFLLVVTILYAGYNLFIKIAGDHVPATATTTISATLILQLAALSTSAVFAGTLAMKGADILALPWRVYLWAALAGICIGGAEITYLYLFGGLGAGAEKLPANIVIPFVVGGTIILSVAASALLFREVFGWSQLAGAGLIVSGLALLFLDTHGAG